MTSLLIVVKKKVTTAFDLFSLSGMYVYIQACDQVSRLTYIILIFGVSLHSMLVQRSQLVYYCDPTNKISKKTIPHEKQSRSSPLPTHSKSIHSTNTRWFAYPSMMPNGRVPHAYYGLLIRKPCKSYKLRLIYTSSIILHH